MSEHSNAEHTKGTCIINSGPVQPSPGMCSFIGASLLIAFAAQPALADDVFAHFNIWVEAPSVVQDGDIIDVAVWAKVSGPMLDIGRNAMAGIRMNLPVGSSGNLVSEVAYPQFGHNYFSSWVEEVNAAGIFDVGVHQLDLFDTPIFRNNPILLFTTRLHTVEGETGLIELVPERRDPTPSIIAWWIDTDDPSRPVVTDLDPNATLTITGKTIRVIPAPGSTSTLLTLVGLGTLRRRR
jgi:hypothetical protein